MSQTNLKENKINDDFNSLWSNETIAAIRKHIKSVAPTLSIKKAGHGWIDVWGSGSEDGRFTEQEALALYELGINSSPVDKSNCQSISFEERKNLLKLWGLLK